MKNIARLLAICLLLVGYLTQAAPAKAFYFEVPKIFQNAVQAFNTAFKAPAGKVKGEFEVAPLQPVQQLVPIVSASQDAPPPPPPSSTCMVNGVETPGGCQPQNPQPMITPADQPQNFQPQQDQTNMPNQPGPDNARVLKDMQRGARNIQSQLKQFEAMVTRLEKKGVVISVDIKTKIEELKILAQKSMSASPEEVGDLDMNDMGEKMRDLEDERQNLQQMDNILREMNRIQNSIKAFENQLQKIVKQKIPVPQEVADNLAKVKAAIAEIKAGKLDNADDIFELVQNLDENRGEMEMLSRWPQTVKEMDRQIKNLDSQLKKAKTIMNRLAKKNIDLSGVYAQFEAAVAKMKETRDAAKAKVAENAADAFDLVQNDFFGQMEDTMQNQKIIMIMGNSSQFRSDFARQTNQAAQQIKKLKGQKIDTADLEDILSQMKSKGAEVNNLFKTQPLDPDAVIEALDELQNLAQDFAQKVSDLTGVEANMPWDNGPQQFKPIEVSPALNNLIPRQPMNSAGEGGSGGQTCNINGVETPGACKQ